MDLNQLIVQYRLRLVLIFGSYGTERFTSDSDLDIAYESEGTLSALEEPQLFFDRIFYFKKDRIDRVNLKKAGPLLAYEIACHARVLYQTDPESFLDFQLKASARYADTQFLREARKQWLNEQLER
ncbi:MAG TPA: nucleotidyltransferase domain-containing protein [Firmicutes bacterium]|jgi:uncharacterized protein|nr:nucleotidyltransferase domain-containing protein [Bacillota bacterium]